MDEGRAMTKEKAKPAHQPMSDPDDDDVPKAYVRPGDDPMLDAALAQLKGEGGDDPLFRDMSGAVTELTDPPAAPMPDHAQYVEPVTVPPGRDPTLENRRVVIADRVDPRKAPTQRVQVVGQRAGLPPVETNPKAPRTLGHTAKLQAVPAGEAAPHLTGGVPPLAARTIGGRTEKNLPAVSSVATTPLGPPVASGLPTPPGPPVVDPAALAKAAAASAAAEPA